MNIKYKLVKLAEKITGRKCCRCAHNCGGRCCHPNGETFCRCWQSITRPGFYDKHNWPFKCPTGDPGQEAAAPGDMTQEEKCQLEQIVTSVQEAGQIARDGGLLGALDEWQEIMDSANGEK